MKNEVDLIKELWQENLELTEEELDKNFDEGFDLMREIAKSQNTKLLPDLLELFTDRNEDYGGVCETLMNDIWNNYTADQIIEAISVKFDYLIKKFGYENFGLGTDLFGIEKEFLPTDFSGYSEIENIAFELKQLNYSQEVVDAILFKNFEKFLSIIILTK